MSRVQRYSGMSMPPRAVHKLEEAGWIFDSKKGGALRFFCGWGHFQGSLNYPFFGGSNNANQRISPTKAHCLGW